MKKICQYVNKKSKTLNAAITLDAEIYDRVASRLTIVTLEEKYVYNLPDFIV